MVDSFIRLPSDPHLRRWMLFVDGENFTIRGQELAASQGLALEEGQYYSKDEFMWMPSVKPTQFIGGARDVNLQPHAVRGHYYTCTTGAEDEQKRIRQALWDLGFNPVVMKKDKKTGRSKGVDITLTKDLLGHAFLNNYDVAVLLAGDGDYIPLVSEVKRLGKLVYVSFFVTSGLDPSLRLESDTFLPLDEYFVDKWKEKARGGTA